MYFHFAVEEYGVEEGTVRSQTGRRTCLPAPQPDTSHLSLWNILKKNIGKDLSKIAMPVALNEPLSMLQVSVLFGTLGGMGEEIWRCSD